MSAIESLKRATLSLGAIGLGLALAAPAFAGPDKIYPSAASAMVSAAPAALTTNFPPAPADGHATFDDTVFDGQQIVVTSTWSIHDRSAVAGIDTGYPKTVTFTATTEQTPGPAVVVSAILNCGVTSSASTCIRDISFSAPATAGDYQVEVAASSSGMGGPLTGSSLFINFTVTDEVEPLATQLTVAGQCVLLNQGDVDLGATLTELLSGDPITGAGIDFSVAGDSAGSATTGADGVATLGYNVNHLGVGDYPIYAAYAGSELYTGSNDSDTLGISYVFTGFKQPINADGNSVFGNGQVIPVKIELLDYLGQPVPDAAPTVWLQALLPGGVGDEVEATSVSAADTGNVMRYVPEEGIYIYNMDLKSLDNGTYKVFVRLGDSETCSAGNPSVIITVAKKGKK